MATLVQDSFTDTAGTNLSAHTPDVDTVGGGWVAEIEDCQIASDGLTLVATGFNGGTFIDCGESDFVASITSISRSFGQYNGLAFRVQDRLNILVADIDDSTAEFRLRSRIAGSWTVLDNVSIAGYTRFGEYIIKVTCNGDSVTAEIESEALSIGATIATFNTQTKVGPFAVQSGADLVWDDLLIEDLGGGPPPAISGGVVFLRDDVTVSITGTLGGSGNPHQGQVGEIVNIDSEATAWTILFPTTGLFNGAEFSIKNKADWGYSPILLDGGTKQLEIPGVGEVTSGNIALVNAVVKFVFDLARDLWQVDQPFINPVTWHGNWVNGRLYPYQAMVNDSNWVMVANEQTYDRPAPQTIGGASWDIPIDPFPGAEQTHSGVVLSGHEYTFTQGGWFLGIEVHIPAVTTNTTYRILVENLDTGGALTVEGVELTAGQWNKIVLDTAIIPNGSRRRVLLYALESGSDTLVTGGWDRSANSNGIGTNPLTGGWGTRNNQTHVRIHKTDLDSTDRSTELLGVVPGSTITITNTLDTSQSMSWTVNGDPTDEITHVGFDAVTYDGSGIGGQPPVGATCTVSIVVPVPQPTRYNELASNWPTNNPSWATIEGHLEYDGVEQAGKETSAFGVRVAFQPAYISDDWDVVTPNYSGAIPTPLTYDEVVASAYSHWKMDDNAATDVVLDDKGVANGTLTAGNTDTRSVAGAMNTALSFSGTEYISGVGDATNFTFVQNTGVFAISFWVKFNAQNVRYFFMGNAASSTEKGFFVCREYGVGAGTNAIRIYGVYGSSGNAVFDFRTPDNVIADTNWHHVCIQNKFAAADNSEIWVDGVSQTLTLGSPFGTLSTGNSTRGVHLARANYTSHLTSLNGALDDVMFFERALSGEEISTLFSEGSP